MPRPGAAAAVDLCGEAHAVLGRRDADARTWDHASRELAMAYLCLGVERRCVLAGPNMHFARLAPKPSIALGAG